MPLDKGFSSRTIEASGNASSGYTPNGRLYREGNALGTIQRIRYNEIEFPAAYKTSATITPEYSNSGKRPIGTRIKIMVETIFVDQTLSGEQRAAGEQVPTTDNDLIFIRRQLSEPGRLLIFSLQGLGMVSVSGTSQDLTSVANVQADIDNGPKTTLVTWEPITPLAAKVVWEVETFVNICDFSFSGGQATFVGTGTINFRDVYCEIDTNVRKNGYMERIIKGEIKVPSLTNPSSDVPTAAELEAHNNILETMFPRLTHFNREYSTNLSPDGATLSFTITDSELETESPYFPGISEMSAELSVACDINEEGGGFGKWTASLNGNLEVSKGVSKLYGFLAAISLIDHYTAKGFEGSMPKGADTKYEEAEPDNTSWAILTSLRFSDSIYSRNLSFSAEWTLSTSWDTLIQATGLFKPCLLKLDTEGNPTAYPKIKFNGGAEEAIEGDSAPITFERWSNTMARTQVPTGSHHLIFSHSQFPNVAVCGGQLANLPYPIEWYYNEPTEAQSETEEEDIPQATTKNNSLSSDKTYLMADLEVTTKENNRTFGASPLVDLPALSEATEVLVADQNNQNRLFNEDAKPFDTSKEDTSKSTIPRHYTRKVGRSSYTVEVVGTLVRAIHRPVIPLIGAIGGKEITKIGEDVTVSKVIGKGTRTAMGKPFAIIATVFRRTYLVADAPESFKVTGTAEGTTAVVDSTVA